MSTSAATSAPPPLSGAAEDGPEMPWPDGYDWGTETPSPGYQDLAAGHIRLLKILPWGPNGELRCQLTPVLLNDRTDYIALSYTWGSRAKLRTITLNGHRHVVGENLWRFLVHVQKHGAKYLQSLWIDALCINQSDLKEKGQQLGLMPDIYKTASQVLVWLGPEYGGSKTAMQAVSKSKSQAKTTKRTLGVWGTPAGTGIHGLCMRPYWGRLWVFQEIMLAKEIEVICGDSIIPWVLFQGLMLELKSRAAPSRTADKADYRGARDSPAMDIVLQTATGNRGGRARSLWDLIMATDNLRCQERVDHVYALLGVATTGAADVIPDYTLSPVILLNTILRNQHNLRRPQSIEEVAGQCRALERVLELPEGSMFSLRGPGPSFLDADRAAFPLNIRHTPISLWWAVYYDHKVVQAFFPGVLNHGRSLVEAAREGNSAVVKLLLDTPGVNANTKSETEGQTPLHLAVWHGPEEIVKLLLDNPGVDVNLPNKQGQTPLHLAVSRGHTAAVLLLLQTPGIEVNADDRYGHTPLRSAAVHGREYIAQLLLDIPGIIIDPRDKNGLTPLWGAATRGFESITKLLLQTGQVDTNVRDKLKLPLLEAVAQQGHEAIVRLLLDVPDVDPEPEQAVAAKDDSEFMEMLEYVDPKDRQILLRNYTKNVDPKVKRITEAFRGAASRGREAVARFLLDTGQVDVNLIKQNKTPLFAAASGKSTAIATMLLDAGADVDAKDYRDRTALFTAVGNADEDMVRLLVARGVDMEARDSANEETALFQVPDPMPESLICLLLDLGADVNAQEKAGSTMLHRAAVAARTGRPEAHGGETREAETHKGETNEGETRDRKKIAVFFETRDRKRIAVQRTPAKALPRFMKLLAERAADPNARAGAEMKKLQGARTTPAAVKGQEVQEEFVRGHPGLVRLLLERGADPSLRNRLPSRNGKTALEEARTKPDNEEVVALLLQHEPNT